MADEQLLRMAQRMAGLDRRVQRLEVQDRPEGGSGGTASMTAAEILTALKTVDGTGSSLDADLLDGYHATALAGTAEVAAGTILAKLLTVDGTGTGLDADLLDGQHGTAFAAVGHTHTGYAGTAEVTAGTILAKLLTEDGTGSGLDADLLDGQHAAAFAGTAHTHSGYVGTATLADYLRRDGATALTADWAAGSYQISLQTLRAEMLKPVGTAGFTLRGYTLNAPVLSIADGTAVFGTAGYPTDVNVIGALAQQGTAVSLDGHTHSYLPLSGGTISGAIDTGAGVALTLKQDGLGVLATAKTSAEAYLQLGNGRTADGPAYIDLIADTTYTDYGLRILRNSGSAGVSQFRHRGAGDWQFYADEAAAIKFSTSATLAATINSSQQVGIGVAPATQKLKVLGSIAVGGDEGGTSGYTTLTNVWNETLSSGTGTIKMAGATNRNSTGWLKLYNGTGARYLPTFTTITG